MKYIKVIEVNIRYYFCSADLSRSNGQWHYIVFAGASNIYHEYLDKDVVVQGQGGHGGPPVLKGLVLVQQHGHREVPVLRVQGDRSAGIGSIGNSLESDTYQISFTTDSTLFEGVLIPKQKRILGGLKCGWIGISL